VGKGRQRWRSDAHANAHLNSSDACPLHHGIQGLPISLSLSHPMRLEMGFECNGQVALPHALFLTRHGVSPAQEELAEEAA
jgi:hypothetical protein